MIKDKVSDKSGKSRSVLDMRSLRNLIYNWKTRYILNYSPQYVLNRTKLLFYELRHPDHPWLTQQANQILSTLLRQQDVGLEWGSGRSTSWFAQRIKHLTSVEHDEAWYKAVYSKLKVNNISNVNYLLCKLDEGNEKTTESSYVQVANTFSKESLDLVIIDGKYRSVCANIVLEKIRPGGIIVIDNVERYLPYESISTGSKPNFLPPISVEWSHFLNRVNDWRFIWTSNGIWDTVIRFKP